MKRAATRQIERTNSRETKRYPTKGKPVLGAPSARWYDAPRDQVHEYTTQYVRNIKTRQVRRRYELAIFQQMYTNNMQNVYAASGLFASTYTNAATAYSRISANVVKSCVDTATARIAKSKPRAFVLPNKGDRRLKVKCRNLTKFLDGAMFSAGVYENSEDVFRDACIYGDGALLLRAENGKVTSEVVKVDELIIDPVTGMYNELGGPQEVHWEHAYPRTKVLAKYGKDPMAAKAIEEARMSWRGDMAFMSQQDMVLVTESWRMPSTPDAKDGRHVVAICNYTLLDEPWNKDYIPIVRFHWTPPTYGPFGQGIALELEAAQWTITNIIRDITESVHKFAVPRVWLDSLSGVSQHAITNELSVNKYSGQPPVFSTPEAMAADVYQFLQWLIDWCYKQLGLSQLTSQSEKPAGLNSGVAMRTYQDVETQRFAIVGQRWERFYMRVARVMIDMAAEMFKKEGALSVKVPGRGFIEIVDWKDASVSDDLYDLQVWPTNILPETPEGRLQAVQELINSGFMPKDVALAQMGMPVLYDWIDKETAARDAVEADISRILDKGKYFPPDAIGNVDIAVEEAQAAYNEAKDDEHLPPKRLDMVLRYLTAALKLQAAKNAPPARPTGAAPGAPAGAVGQAPAPPPAPLAPAGAGAVQMPAAA